MDSATAFIRSVDIRVAVVGDIAGGHLRLNIARRANSLRDLMNDDGELTNGPIVIFAAPVASADVVKSS